MCFCPLLVKVTEMPCSLKQGELEHCIVLKVLHTNTLAFTHQPAPANLPQAASPSFILPHSSFFYQLAWSKHPGTSSWDHVNIPSIIHVLFSGHKDRGAWFCSSLRSDALVRWTTSHHLCPVPAFSSAPAALRHLHRVTQEVTAIQLHHVPAWPLAHPG